MITTADVDIREVMENAKTRNDALTLDSRDVAEMVEKNHAHLMRDIKNYREHISTNPELDSLDFFIEKLYTDSKGEKRPCYSITRKGCEFVANKLTGQKGTIFTATYINRFHDMEEEIKKPRRLSAKEELRLHYQAIEEQSEEIADIKNEVSDLKENMPLFNIDCEEIQGIVRKVGIKVLGGYKSTAYDDNSIRGKVYADIQNQLKREFGVKSYKSIKRVQLDQAMEIVKNYKAPLILQERIRIANKQMKIIEGGK